MVGWFGDGETRACVWSGNGVRSGTQAPMRLGASHEAVPHGKEVAGSGRRCCGGRTGI